MIALIFKRLVATAFVMAFVGCCHVNVPEVAGSMIRA
ncbi:hypothetical protein BAL199_14667 [alpha proteobacterium BAL199]|nr:hypothetical protein BAL199_14667 [alpha proteobacterium BAL199]